MDAVLETHNQKIPMSVRTSRRAKRARILIRHGRVEVISPASTHPMTLRKFVFDHADWISKTFKQIANQPWAQLTRLPSILRKGQMLLRGKYTPVRVVETEARGVRLIHRDGIEVRVDRKLQGEARRAAISRALQTFLKDKLYRRAEQLIGVLAPQLGVKVRTLTIRQQRSRWGSCSSRGTVSLNLQLVHAPDYVLEYVIAHELCHLKHFNHSPKFWKLMGELMPTYPRAENWLRDHGIALQMV